MRVGAVILAAGAATRMGQIKQLLPYQGRTFVEHAVLQAQGAGFTPIVVVLGAQWEAVSEAVRRTSAKYVVNEKWLSGMGSSVITGVDGILKIFPDLDAIAILLADQPCIATDHLAKMQSIFATSNVPILAANYAGTVGVPALFRSSLFPKLKELAPDAGARTLLREGNTDVQHYDLPEAAIDIDTPEDFAALG